MRTSLDLLNEIVKRLAFDQKETLVFIDKFLDKKLGIQSRKPLLDEKISDNIYEEILNIFIEKSKQKTF